MKKQGQTAIMHTSKRHNVPEGHKSAKTELKKILRKFQAKLKHYTRCDCGQRTNFPTSQSAVYRLPYLAYVSGAVYLIRATFSHAATFIAQPSTATDHRSARTRPELSAPPSSWPLHRVRPGTSSTHYRRFLYTRTSGASEQVVSREKKNVAKGPALI